MLSDQEGYPVSAACELLELQRRVASDVLDRTGLKPKEQHELSGEVKVTLLDVMRERRKRRGEE